MAHDDRGDHPPQLGGLARIAKHRNGAQAVDHEHAAYAGKQWWGHPEQVHHAVPGVTDDGVEQDHRNRPDGSFAASSVTSRPPIE